MAQPAIDKQATNVEPTGADQTENFPHPKEPVEQNGTPETAAEVEMVDITLPFFLCFFVCGYIIIVSVYRMKLMRK